MHQIIYRSMMLALTAALLLTLLFAGVLAEEVPENGTDSPLFSSNPFESITRSDSTPGLAGVWPKPEEGFLPVCYRKNTDEKIVALTIDDCNEAGNLKKIISAIAKEGGTATIFPIGENVSFLAPTLRDAADLGFEIENHTMSHSGLYHEDDTEFARQIWQQNHEVSKALGGDYQMHFLRPRGGDNRYDQRTHAYMRQMGYHGIAYWSQDGSHSTAKEIMKRLTPGDIILFHTTDEDVKIIRNLIPKLRAKGYRMVTLNQMFGLDENALTLPVSGSNVVPLAPYVRINQTLRAGDYLRDVYLMQEQLNALGYLDSPYNGFFGKATEKALRAFQKDENLPSDGICGRDTWNALFSAQS